MSHHDLIVFFLEISVMLAIALSFRQLARMLNLPLVIGELIGGILLGPTAFGALAPKAYAWLFPTAGPAVVTRDSVIRLGLLFFLFCAGLEVNLAHLRRRGLSIAWTSILGIVVPFALGFSLVQFVPAIWGHSVEQKFLALFIGTALSISALPVIARILMDLHLMKKELGVVVMSAAMIDDLIGWSLFAVILSITNPNGASSRSLWINLLLVLFLFASFLTAGRWAGQRSLRWMQSRPTWPNGFIGVTSVIVLLAAAMAEAIGIHAVFGAFLVGVALAQTSDRRHEAHEMVHHFVMSFFAPIYFVSVGLQADFARNFDLPLVILMLVVACLGKIGGVTLGGWLAKMPLKQALAVGFGMNARGAMGMILASVALEHKLIDQRIFVALIVMALVTSLSSGPFMQRLLALRPAAEEGRSSMQAANTTKLPGRVSSLRH